MTLFVRPGSGSGPAGNPGSGWDRPSSRPPGPPRLMDLQEGSGVEPALGMPQPAANLRSPQQWQLPREGCVLVVGRLVPTLDVRTSAPLLRDGGVPATMQEGRGGLLAAVDQLAGAGHRLLVASAAGGDEQGRHLGACLSAAVAPSQGVARVALSGTTAQVVTLGTAARSGCVVDSGTQLPTRSLLPDLPPALLEQVRLVVLADPGDPVLASTHTAAVELSAAQAIPVISFSGPLGGLRGAPTGLAARLTSSLLIGDDRTIAASHFRGPADLGYLAASALLSLATTGSALYPCDGSVTRFAPAREVSTDTLAQAAAAAAVWALAQEDVVSVAGMAAAAARSVAF